MTQRDEDRLRIQTPCTKRWSELSGEGTRRWCDACSLHVVDGASLTKAAAEALVASTEERVCMRILEDADGRTIHAADAPRSPRVGALLRYGLGAAAAGALSACDGREVSRTPVDGAPAGPSVEAETTEAPTMPPELLGSVCFPVEVVGRIASTREIVSDVAPEEAPDDDAEPPR